MSHRSGRSWAPVAAAALLAALATAVRAEETPQDREIRDLRRRVEALERKADRPASPGLLDGTRLHGYGEVHYHNPRPDVMTRRGTSSEADVHRLVIGVAHEFTDRIRFDMEIDFEHAANASDLEVEYAQLEFDLTPGVSARVGALLMPVGSLNEFHEPPNFYSVDRPQLHQKVIPTTWQEIGFGLAGRAMDDRLSFRTYFVTGLRGTGFTNSTGLRGGRTKLKQAPADDFGIVGRAEYRPLRGVQFGASGYYGEADQDDTGNLRRNVEVGIYTADVRYEVANFDLRAEYAAVEIGNAGLLGSAASPVGSRLEGWNAEVGYRLGRLIDGKGTWDLVPFVRYEEVDTNDRVPPGRAPLGTAERQITTVGVAYFPIRNIALKADAEHWEDDLPSGVLWRYNLGIAWMF